MTIKAYPTAAGIWLSFPDGSRDFIYEAWLFIRDKEARRAAKFASVDKLPSHRVAKFLNVDRKRVRVVASERELR